MILEHYSYLVSLYIAEPFVLAVTSSPTLVSYGNNVTISFSILGDHPTVNPVSGIVWTLQRSSQSGSTVLSTENPNERYTFENGNERLVIDPVRLEDEGTYSLTATNDGGSRTDDVVINVVGKRWFPKKWLTILIYYSPVVLPMIREASATRSIGLRERVAFTCTVDALPSPSITWRRNGTIIITRANPRWQLSEIDVVSDVTGAVGVRSTLTLLEVRITDDNSLVECTATNGYRDTSILYTLQLQGVQGTKTLLMHKKFMYDVL